MYILFVSQIRNTYLYIKEKMQIVNNNLANAEHNYAIEPEISGDNNTHPEYPIEENYKEVKKEEINSLSQSEQENTDKRSIVETIDKKVMPVTAFGSAILNFISAPIRLFDDDNPLKKLINKVSMFGTKLHLALYGAIGMMTAHEQKNPFLLFSFAVECLSSMFDLRKIYLFRGIATGIDGAVGAFKDRFEERNPGKDFKHQSYSEGFNKNISLFKEIINEIKENPMKVVKLEGAPTLVASSILMVFGSVFGLTVNDALGASVRDIFGGFNDFGLTQLESKIARKSGGFYLLGTFKDLIARFFTEKNAKVFGVTEVEKFKRGRDVMHELALGFDRIGQYYFLRFNQEGNTNQATMKKENDRKSSLHKAQETNYDLAT
jgi:hypothetical protein